MTPPNSPRCSRRKAAYFRPSAGVSTAPWRVDALSIEMVRCPDAASTRGSSARASAISDAGKKPRLP